MVQGKVTGMKYYPVLKAGLARGNPLDPEFRELYFASSRQTMIRMAEQGRLDLDRLPAELAELDAAIGALRSECEIASEVAGQKRTTEQSAPPIQAGPDHVREITAHESEPARPALRKLWLAALVIAAIVAVLSAGYFIFGIPGGRLQTSGPADAQVELAGIRGIEILAGDPPTQAGEAAIAEDGSGGFVISDDDPNSVLNYRWISTGIPGPVMLDLSIVFDERDPLQRFAQFVLLFNAEDGASRTYNILVDFLEASAHFVGEDEGVPTTFERSNGQFLLRTPIRNPGNRSTLVLYVQPAVGGTPTGSIAIRGITLDFSEYDSL